ncbi:hypothetical protein JCM8097_003261 [Rhodosporidiobolus ruineniae]
MRRRSSVALPNFGVRRRDSNASASSSLKDEIVKDIFHVGLVNLGNSCFYNTIVQSLSATQPLTDIINEAPESSPALQVLSPSSPNYNPDLDALPSPLPMTAALLVLLNKLDPANEDGTLGKKAFNPKSLLRQLSLKHEEYAEATQQDSHELLRHLVDGVFMEEQDLIKKLKAEHAARHSSVPRRPSMHTRSTTVKAVFDAAGDAVVPEDSISDESASVHDENSASAPTEDEGDESDSESSSSSESEAESEEEIGEEERKKRMRPFVGSIFEGKLSSFIICDECKNVSLTKEDFMDLSLSLRDDAGNRMRKRDRIRRTLRAGFFRKGGSSKDSGSEDVKQAPNGLRSGSALSETEGSASPSEADETDEDHIKPAALQSRSRHNSLDPTKLTRNGAQASLAPPEGNSHPRSASTSNGDARGPRDPSPLGRALSVLSRGSDGHHHLSPHFHRRPKIPKPTKEQIAYIKQVLVDVPGPDSNSPALPPGLRVARPPGSPQPPSPALPSSADAGSVSSTTSSLARLRLNAPTVDWQGTDLFECFRQFTAVEVLEGENSFACRNCWKMLNPDLEAKRKEAKLARRADRKLRRAARAQSTANGAVTAAVEVDGEGNVLRPQDIVRKEKAEREKAVAAAVEAGEQAGVDDDEDSDDESVVGRQGDLTARNTPAASPRAMPTISTLEPESSIPPIEPLEGALPPSSAAAKPERRHFSMSSTATSGMRSVSTDYEGGVSSEAFETTTDEEDNDDSPELDTTSLSGSVADLNSAGKGSTSPLTAENVAAASSSSALTPPAGENGKLAVPSRPTTATSNGSGVNAPPSPSPSARSLLSKSAGPPPKTQRHILRRAHKRYLISAPDLPPVLVVHLKRFMQTSKSSLFGSAFVNLKKRDDPVSFPKEMDLSPFLAPKGRPPRPSKAAGEEESRSRSRPTTGQGEGLGLRSVPEQLEGGVEVEVEVQHARYRLYAAVVHFGTIDTGHYASYVLSNRYGKGVLPGASPTIGPDGKPLPPPSKERRWVFCSDEEVTAVSEAEVMRSKPYMLFYERINPTSTPVPGSTAVSSSAASPVVPPSSSSAAASTGTDSPRALPSDLPPTIPEGLPVGKM